ncbi:MAG: methyltransferase [Bacteroidota bacterium]
MSQIERFEGERATNYDSFVHAWIPNYSYFMNQLPKLLRETKNKILLVVGCGTGAEIERFVLAKEEWTIIGVDPSPDMIAQSIQHFKRDRNVRLIEGVVEDLDTTQLYGAATLLLVLHFIPDDGTKLNLLKSIAERLDSDAPFILLDITGDKAQIKANLNILKYLLPSGLEQQDVTARLKRIETQLHIVSEERISELLVEAGFETPLRFFQTSIYMGWMTRKA